MIHTHGILVAIVLGTGGLAPGGDMDDPVPGRAAVGLQVGVDIDDFLTQVEADHAGWDLNMQVSASIPSRNMYLLDFDHKGLTPQQLDQLETELETGYLLSFLLWGEFDYEGESPEGRTGSFWLSIDPAAGPGLFDGQFAVDTLGLTLAHAGSTGAGTVVAVLDTGVDATHPLLAGRVVAGGWNFVDGNADTSDAGNGADDDGDLVPDEMVGHGTFVASLVALAAPDARILPIRVLNGDGVGENWTVAMGIYHAIDRGVEVINLSLGSTYDSDAVEDAIAEAAALGIVTIGAAGNQNHSEPEEFPALDTDAFGVAAADDEDVKGSFSNYNEDLALTAPGANMFLPGEPGTYDLDRSVIGALPGGEYGVWEGTSFSTAFVSAAAALVRAQHPQWPDASVPVGEITEAISQVLARSAVDIDAINPQYAGQLGAGRLDLGAAVSLGPPAPTLGDLNADGVVSTVDLLALLSAWGEVHASADLDGSGLVGGPDLLILIANWG